MSHLTLHCLIVSLLWLETLLLCPEALVFGCQVRAIVRLSNAMHDVARFTADLATSSLGLFLLWCRCTPLCG